MIEAVCLSFLSSGVPVKPMKTALGSIAFIVRCSLPLWVRWHSSTKTKTSPTVWVNIRLTHPAFRKTAVFFGAIWYNIPHETDPATIDLYLRLGAGQRAEHQPFHPTNGGADEAGLYRPQVGSELLASPTCAACGA